MKMNKYFYLAAAATLLMGCAKEQDQKVEEVSGKVYTIEAAVENPATRSIASLNGTTDLYEFAWAEDETIAVVPDGYDPLSFNVVDTENGTFSYTAGEGEPEYTRFSLAVSPEDALQEATVDGGNVLYTIQYSGSYLQGQSNAIMVAGAPTEVFGNQKFQFKHVGALVRVTYNNVPAGTFAMVFSTDDNFITGTFEFKSATGVEAIADNITPTDNTEAWVMLKNPTTAVVETMDFYLPIPTGSYKTFQVRLVDKYGATINGTEQTFSVSNPFTVSRADVVECPAITLTPSLNRYYTKVTSNDQIGDGKYLMIYESDDDYIVLSGISETSTKYGVGVSIKDKYNASASGFLETNVEDYALQVGKVGESYTIMGTFGYLWWGSGNSLNANDQLQIEGETNKSLWNIFFDQNASDVTVQSAWTTARTIRYNTGSPRFACYTSGQQAIALYKLEDNRTALATPQNLAVNADTKVVTWDAVTDADSYEVTVGTTTETVSETTYTFTGTDGYYDVSVVAVPASTDTEHKKSAAATLVDAKFGTPALATPVLTKGEVNETSIEVTWTLDENAVNGYACEIYQGETKLDKDQTVTAGSVTFEGLIQNVTYTIKVKAIAVSGEKPYAESETASIDITTDEAVTISKLLEDGTTSDNVTLPSATVMAKQGDYTVLSDDTGSILAYKASGTYEIGDVVMVVGKIGTHSNAYEFNNGTTITKISGGEAVYPAENVISTEAPLTSFATGEEGSVRVTYATLRGVSNAGKLTIGTKTITVYNSIPTQFNDENVQVTGYLTGWYQKNESSALSIYFVRIGDVTLNESDPRLSVTSPETKVLNWAWNENGNENAKVISLDINGEATGYTVTFADAEDNPVSDPSADWNITNDATAKTITVYPVSEATSAGKVLKVIIAHNDDPTLSETVTLTQTAAPEHEITINPATNPIVLSGTQDSPYTVTVTSNYAWSATTTGAGFSVSPVSGNAGETTVTITPSANGGNAETELGTLTFTDAVDNSVSSSFTVKQAAYVATTTYTYTFNSKSWGAKLNDNDANWKSGKDGNSFQNNQGVQVTTGVSGANATSPKAFTGVSKIVVTYCTNASKGAGKIKVKIGDGSEKSFSVTAPKSGGTTLKTTEFEFSPNESGAVKLTAECTTNSVYIYSIAITAAGIAE